MKHIPKCKVWTEVSDEEPFHDTLCCLNVGNDVILEFNDTEGEFEHFRHDLKSGIQKLYPHALVIQECLGLQKLVLTHIKMALADIGERKEYTFSDRMKITDALTAFRVGDIKELQLTVNKFKDVNFDNTVSFDGDCPEALCQFLNSKDFGSSEDKDSTFLKITNLGSYYGNSLKTPTILVDNKFTFTFNKTPVEIEINDALGLIKEILPEEVIAFKELLDFQKFSFDFIKECVRQITPIIADPDDDPQWEFIGDFLEYQKENMPEVVKTFDNLSKMKMSDLNKTQQNKKAKPSIK